MSRPEGALTKSAIAALVGLQASDTIGFYGATPVAQPVVLAAVSTSASLATTTTTVVFGFRSSAQFDALIAAVNTIITDLQTLGLMASS